MTLYEKVQALCEGEGFAISNLSEKIPGVKLTRGTISGWKKGAKPRADTLKAIADYFGVDVNYLTSEGPVEIQTVQDNHGIIGHAHAPVTINNGDSRKLSEQEIELLDIFNSLSILDRAKLIVYASELKATTK